MATWVDWDIEPVARALIMSNSDPAFCAGVYALATALGAKLDYRMAGWLYQQPATSETREEPCRLVVKR